MKLPAAVATCLVLACALVDARGGDVAVVMRLDAATSFQTWEAWSCVPNPSGYERPFEAWLKAPTRETYDRVPVAADLPWKLVGKMHDALVSDIGITRVRLEVGPQVEPVNDDDDPRHTDEAAFRFAWQDDQIERHVLPLKRRIEAAGERMTIYVSYDLRSSLTPAFLLVPEEYAEMAGTFLRHVKTKYAIEPDYWSVLNEPGNHRPGDPKLCAELTAATGRRIAAAGLRTKMSGPECVTVAQAARYLQAMADTPGALEHFRQITYHLYFGGADDASARNAVREWGKKLKVTAAQTEWMEASGMDVARHIHMDLTEADAVAWDRFGADLFFNLEYAAWLDPKSDGLTELRLSSTAWHIRQFSRFIRPGAVRVGLTGGSASMKGVAFASKTKRMPTIVLLNTGDAAQTLRLDGLSAGTYARSFTSTPMCAFGKKTDDMKVDASGTTTVELPAQSVTTLSDPGI